MSVDRPGASSSAGAHTTTPEPGIDLTDRSEERESIGELISATTRDISELFRKEVELAKTELREEASATGKAGAMMVAGGLLGYLALLLVLLAASWLLAEAIPLWLSLLIVGIVAGAIAAVLVMTGRSRLREVRAAPNTIETLQEDVQWAKQQLS